MSKKSRILSILAVVLCLCLSSIIGYRGGHTLGLHFGYIEGCTTAYAETARSLTTPTTTEPSLYVSAENSIARRQAAPGGVILPLDTRAFEPNEGDFELSELKWWTGYESFRDFFESTGIVIIEESELTGWFRCELPEGWSVNYDDTPDRSHDEAVYYMMPDGTEAFHIISHKNMTNQATSLSPNLDLFENHFGN